ncbi:MAG: tsaE [Firmicutes bacterium]|nr:tsaE [Bacillota bacterium]
MGEFITTRPEETLQLGKRVAAKLEAGDVICLSGDLGAGKTLFTQGIAEGLGVSEDVTSPTFTIMQVYEEGRLAIYHFDLYRLDRIDELENIGFDEYIGHAGVAIIEWADKFREYMPQEYLWIEILLGQEPNERIIRVNGVGDRFVMLCEGLK